MPEFLARTDILVSLLPLTPDTRGVINATLLAGLAQDGRLGGPYLVNAGRGGLQVEADILAALEAGTLKGATLDVFETEPLPAESPLWSPPGGDGDAAQFGDVGAAGGGDADRDPDPPAPGGRAAGASGRSDQGVLRAGGAKAPGSSRGHRAVAALQTWTARRGPSRP